MASHIHHSSSHTDMKRRCLRQTTVRWKQSILCNLRLYRPRASSFAVYHSATSLVATPLSATVNHIPLLSIYSTGGRRHSFSVFSSDDQLVGYRQCSKSAVRANASCLCPPMTARDSIASHAVTIVSDNGANARSIPSDQVASGWSTIYRRLCHWFGLPSSQNSTSTQHSY